MKRVGLALVAVVLAVSLAVPQAQANPAVVRPLDSASSPNSPVGPCLGLNESEDSYIPGMVSGLRIALIQPIFTATPYSQYGSGSFYAFYAKEAGVTTNVTTNLNLLSTNVSSGYDFHGGWGLSYKTYLFFNSVFAKWCGFQLGKNVQILTDIDVANGALFDSQNNKSRFDVVVLPFSEYVETSEYVAYENFVAGGGTLVMMAHSLEYQVTYNATTHIETLVYGHGWAFNGKYARPIPCGRSSDATCPWAKNNTDWVGSTSYLGHTHVIKYAGSIVNTGNPIGRAISDEFGGTVFKSYASHEENTITNMSGTSIVSIALNDSKTLVASYTHQFRKGVVVNFGIFGDDIIQSDQSAQYFMLLGATLSKSLSTSTVPSSPSSPSSASSLTSQPTATSTLSMVAASTSRGALASVMALGGLAAVILIAGLVVRRRRQVRPRSRVKRRRARAKD